MVRVRQLLFDDVDKIVGLMHRFNMGLAERGGERLRLLWSDSPVFKKCEKNWPMGWVLENDSKSIVGALFNIPLEYSIEGKSIIAAVAGSWVVDEKYRSYSFHLMRAYFRQDLPDLFLTTTANIVSGKTWNAMRAKKMPVDTYGKSQFRVINNINFSRSLLIKKSVYFNTVLSYPFAAVLFVFSVIKNARLPKKRQKSNVTYLTDFNEKFDAIWNKLKIDNNILLCSRDGDSLRWHFNDYIVKKNIWICVIYNEGKITSYAILVRHDVPNIKLKRMTLIDLQTIEEDSIGMESLLCDVIERCKKEGVDMLESIGFSVNKRNVIEQFAPFKRKIPVWPFYYKATNDSLARKLEDKNLWDPCLLDGDSSL